MPNALRVSIHSNAKSKNQHEANESDNKVIHYVTKPQPFVNEKPEHSIDGPKNGIATKRREAIPQITSSKTTLPKDQVQALVSSRVAPTNPFNILRSKQLFSPKTPANNHAGPRDRRPRSNSYIVSKLQLHQGLSKRQIRRAKKEKRRLQICK